MDIYKMYGGNQKFWSGGVAEFLPPTPSFRRAGADFGKVCKITLAILHEIVSSRTVKIHQTGLACLDHYCG